MDEHRFVLYRVVTESEERSLLYSRNRASLHASAGLNLVELAEGPPGREKHQQRGGEAAQERSPLEDRRRIRRVTSPARKIATDAANSTLASMTTRRGT